MCTCWVYCPHEQLMQLLAATDMTVIPSMHEGFGIIAAEAMAMGRPLVGYEYRALS